MMGEEKLHRPHGGTALYVHFPYCQAKCHYCDFFSVPGAGEDLTGLVDALVREAAMRAAPRPSTVYLGGGTPSYLDAPLLARLLDGLDREVSFRSSATEVTVECNPESLTADKAAALVDLGATRVSIGFQSLDARILALFGRVHDVSQSLRAYEAARQAGFRGVNIDLIYAVPGQDPGAWSRELDRILGLGPDHLSAYSLAFEEETLFARWLEDGELDRVSEPLELEMFVATREIAASRGLAPYEISNFARPGWECLHNLNYWRNGAYVGLGPSAASKVGFTRSGNVRSIGVYRGAIARGERPLAWSEHPPADLRLAETWWLGSRLAEGVDPAAARLTAGYDDAGDDPCLAVAHRLSAASLMIENHGRFALSARGLPLADAVAREFLATARRSSGASVARLS